MNALIVAGTPWCPIDAILAIVADAGMEHASAANTGSIGTILQWHDRLFAGKEAQAVPFHPGKAWEQAAGEIFLSNWDREIWGWADCRSTWLFDFWRDFEPQTRFVLVHTPIEHVLAHALENAASDSIDVNAVITTWITYNTEFLRFYHRNRERCIIVDAANVLENPSQLVQAAITAWNLNLSMNATQSARTARDNPLARLLANQIAQNHPEAGSLRLEMQACLSLSQTDSTEPALPNALHAEAIAQLRTLRRAESRLAEAAALSVAHTALTKENADLIAANDSLRNANARLNSETTAQVAAHAKLNEELAKLKEEQAKLKNEHARLNDEKVKLNIQHQTALNEHKTNAGQLQLKLDTLNKEKAALSNAATALRAELEARAREAVNQAKQFDQSRQALEQENELLLMQLHQVQEELETFFLGHHALQAANADHLVSMQRVMTRYPDYCDWGSVEAIAVDANAQIPAVRWRIEGMRVGGQRIGAFEVSTVVLNGHPGWYFDGPHASSPLRAYATEASSAGRLVQPAVADLSNMSASDWELLQTLASVFSDAFQNPAAGLRGLDFDTAFWLDQLKNMKVQLQKAANVWRFDQVTLKHEQVNPDYEHLWLHIDNARFGQRHWPVFEFRLGAAMVKPGKFSRYPRLEFPIFSDGNKAFENWFVESEDDRGEKYELRFDIKADAMDMSAWNALSKDDQAQLRSMLGQLPHLLANLEAQGIRIARDWADWNLLVSQLVEVSNVCLGAMPAATKLEQAPNIALLRA